MPTAYNPDFTVSPSTFKRLPSSMHFCVVSVLPLITPCLKSSILTPLCVGEATGILLFGGARGDLLLFPDVPPIVQFGLGLSENGDEAVLA